MLERLHTAGIRKAISFAVVAGCLVCQSAQAAAPATRSVDGATGDWSGEATWIAGQSQYSRGEWIYQDYIYDDYGPAVAGQRPAQHGASGNSDTSGSYRYPADEARYGNNAADLRQLRLAADAGTVHVLAALTTLKQPDTTVVAVGFDLDRDDATGGGPWPFSAGLTTPGTDLVLTVWGSGGALTDLRTGTTVDLGQAGGAVAQDTRDNAIEASLPRSALGAGPVGLQVATGLWDAAKREWLAPVNGEPTASSPGHGSASIPARAFNVAPRPGESGNWFEDAQASALATGDMSRFQADVDLENLESGATQLAAVTPGFHEGVMTQITTIPPEHEGMSYENCAPGRSANRPVLKGKFCYFGPHQPFAIYLPSTYDGSHPLPMALALHGYGGSHAVYNAQPGFRRDMGENPATILLTPLARGPGGFYLDYAERDTFETLDFVVAKIPVDRDRLYVTGYSMGGYGVFRLGSLYPDLFAGAVSWAGFTGELFGTRADKADEGDAVDVLEGMLHVPVLQLGGTNDQIVPITGQLAASRRLDELGYRHRFDLYPGYEHASFTLVDEWSRARAWLGDLRREKRPARIAYRFSEAWGNPALGIQYGNAYWLSGMRVRDLSLGDGSVNARDKAAEMRTYGSITAESDALSRVEHTTRRVDEARPGPPPYYETGVAWETGGALPLANRLDLSLVNLQRAVVDVAQAGLRTDRELEVVIQTDGPGVIDLRGDFSTTEVSAASASANRSSDRLRLELPASGRYELRVVPRARCRRPSRIAFKLHRAKGTRVVRVEAFANGKRRLRRAGRDLRRIELRRLKRTGKLRIRIVATHSTGAKVVSTRSWDGCKKGKPRVRAIPRRGS